MGTPGRTRWVNPSCGLKSGRTYRADPVLDLGWRLFVHVKEMRHGRSHRLNVRIIECHADFAMKDLQQGAVPKLHDIVMRGQALVDELPQVFSDRLTSMPVGNTEITYGIVCETIKAFAKGLVIDLFPHGEQPFRRCGFRERDGVRCDVGC